VYLLERDPAFVWATVVSFLGLPAVPDWASEGVKWLEQNGRIKEMVGYCCSPAVVTTIREELLGWIGQGVRSKMLPFPTENGPVIWPKYGLRDILSIHYSGDSLPAAAEFCLKDVRYV
jgi:hypothetical protein